MRRVATSWKVIEEVLKENAYSVYKALRPPASAASIRRLEKLIGAKLPQVLVASLLVHNGMQQGVELVDFDCLLPVAEMGNWWRITMDNPWDDPGPRLTNGKRIKANLRWRRLGADSRRRRRQPARN